MKQALAIAYNTKKTKKMAKGGMVEDNEQFLSDEDDFSSPFQDEGMDDEQMLSANHDEINEKTEGEDIDGVPAEDRAGTIKAMLDKARNKAKGR